MKDYKLTHINEDGEIYAVSHRFTSMWEFIGWDVYKNDNWLNFIPLCEFSINGINVTIDTDMGAIEAGIILERLEDEAETAFNKSHPELNP